LLASSRVGSMTGSGVEPAVARQRLALASRLSLRSGEIFYVRLPLLSQPFRVDISMVLCLQEGIRETQFSRLPSSPTVSGRI
jgi:hypothetical protein